jgi:two-component system sensor histidine kinase ChvG
MPSDISHPHHIPDDLPVLTLGGPAGAVRASGAAQATPSHRSRSGLRRKIIAFNMLGLLGLAVGVLYLNPFRDSLSQQYQHNLTAQAAIVTQFLTQDVQQAPLGADIGQIAQDVLAQIPPEAGIVVQVYNPQGDLVALAPVAGDAAPLPPAPDMSHAWITDVLETIWGAVFSILFDQTHQDAPDPSQAQFPPDLASGFQGGHENGRHFYAVTHQVDWRLGERGAVVVSGRADHIDTLVRAERERVLQVLGVALVMSIGLSVVLASTIAKPLQRLAKAVEGGADTNIRKIMATRADIPDLTSRPDEIGRLSGALRSAIGALNDRLGSIEDFVADVSHEVKNPLASLRLAVGALQTAQTPQQHLQTLRIIEHDIKRLDRLICDISNVSRLDVDLVKEHEAPFDLMHMLHQICDFQKAICTDKGIALKNDLPKDPVFISGIEPRLAQVFVNIITNAVSFCKADDAIRVSSYRHGTQQCVVIEDTGPGIAPNALSKIFTRFYSERPADQFGDHSGLGLAISKQIVESHSDTITAENIYAGPDTSAAPIGARFCICLPL